MDIEIGLDVQAALDDWEEGKQIRTISSRRREGCEEYRSGGRERIEALMEVVVLGSWCGELGWKKL